MVRSKIRRENHPTCIRNPVNKWKNGISTISTGAGFLLATVLPSLKNSKFAPENGWLEDDRFLLGFAYFQVGTVSFRERKPWYGGKLLPQWRMMKYSTLLPSPVAEEKPPFRHKIQLNEASICVIDLFRANSTSASQKPFLMESLNPRFQGNLSRIVSRTFWPRKKSINEVVLEKYPTF